MTTSKASAGFSAEEKAAMRERAREAKAAASKADAEKEVMAKIAAMPPADRAMATRVHAVVTEAAPELAPKTYYGMPAYAKDGTVVCWFKDANKFKTRYATLGFSDKARLDDGDSWATEFALKRMTPDVEAMISALVKRAVGT